MPPDVMELVRDDGALRRQVGLLQRHGQQDNGVEHAEGDRMAHLGRPEDGRARADRLLQVVEAERGAGRAPPHAPQAEHPEPDPREPQRDARQDHHLRGGHPVERCCRRRRGRRERGRNQG
jgi:hypothetical protein